MFKFLLVLILTTSTFLYAKTKDTKLIDYKVEQLIIEKNVLKKQVQGLLNDNNILKLNVATIKENHKEEIENNRDLYDKQLTTFQAILGIVGALFLLVTFLGINNLKGYVVKVIGDKANDKITELEKTIEEYKELLEKIKIKTEKEIETFLKNKSETLTTEERELLKKLSEEVKNKQDKTANDWLVIALEYTSKGDNNSAIEAYNMLLKINDNSSFAHYNLGVSYGENKEYKKAIGCYMKSIKSNRHFASSFVNLIEIYIIEKLEFDVELVKEFTDKYKSDKLKMIKYKMLEIIKDITNKKNIDIKLNQWIETYKDVPLNGWTFNVIDTFVEQENNQEIKLKLKDTLEIFKKHKNNTVN